MSEHRRLIPGYCPELGVDWNILGCLRRTPTREPALGKHRSPGCAQCDRRAGGPLSPPAFVPKAELDGEMVTRHMGLAGALYVTQGALRKLTGTVCEFSYLPEFLINTDPREIVVMFGQSGNHDGGRARKGLFVSAHRHPPHRRLSKRRQFVYRPARARR